MEDKGPSCARLQLCPRSPPRAGPAAAHSTPATCTSHLVPSPGESHDAHEASPRSSPITDPTHQSPRLGFSCPGEAGRRARALLWCRGSVSLSTHMEQVRGAGISTDRGVPGHGGGEMSTERSSASHRGTTLTPAITPQGRSGRSCQRGMPTDT